MCFEGTKNSPIAVEGPTKKSVSDGMIESESMDIKYELKRAKNCTKRLDTSFINVAFDQLVGHQQAEPTKGTRERENLTYKQGLIQTEAYGMIHHEIKIWRSALAPCCTH